VRIRRKDPHVDQVVNVEANVFVSVRACPKVHAE